MDEKNQTQFIEALQTAQNIALVLPTYPTIDATATAVALFQILSGLNKTVTLLSAHELPEQLSFLSQPDGVKTSSALPNQTGLEIRVTTDHAQLEQLSYQVESDGIHIFLHAKSGDFLPEDVVAREPRPACDLLVTVGASSLEDLGTLYSEQVDLFFKTPKLVIDTNPDNTYFGTQHAVDVTASSVGEIVASAIVATKPEWLNVDSATALLTAITSATSSFQSIKTTPSSLSLAADLIARGAKQQDVVLHLYKTKPFPLLKLWGRALARAKFIESSSLLFSELTMSDYAKTETGSELAEAVLLELLENSASAHSVALLAETVDGIKLYIASLPHVTQQERLEGLGGRVLSKSQVRGLYTLTVLQLPAFDIVQAESALLQAFA